jgi:hypothetical protein
MIISRFAGKLTESRRVVYVPLVLIEVTIPS